MTGRIRTAAALPWALAFFLFIGLPGQDGYGSVIWSEGAAPRIIAGLLSDLEHKTNGPSGTLEHFVAKSRLLNLQLKRDYETKKSFVTLLSEIGQSKKFHEDFIRQFPAEALGYAGLADCFHFLPGVLGGSQTKAEGLYEKSLSLRADGETLYKALLFHLNGKAEEIPLGKVRREKCDLLLKQLEKWTETPLQPQDPTVLFYKRWTPYQRGVWHFQCEEPGPARTKISEHLARDPKSYWGWYILWRLGKKHPQLLSEGLPPAAICLENAAAFAKERDDRVFLDRLGKEAGKNF